MNNGFILSKLYKKRIAEKRLQKLYIFQKTKHFDFISAIQRFAVRLPVYLRDNGGTDTDIFSSPLAKTPMPVQLRVSFALTFKG